MWPGSTWNVGQALQSWFSAPLLGGQSPLQLGQELLAQQEQRKRQERQQMALLAAGVLAVYLLARKR